MNRTQALVGLLATTLALPGWSANIDLNRVADGEVTATIVPDEAEISSGSQLWMGAVFDGQLYLRDSQGNWQASRNGSYPSTSSLSALGPVNSVSVVNGVNIASLVGLDIYLGYGQDVGDMTGTSGHLSKIYTVTAAGQAGQSAAIDVIKLPLGDGKYSTTQAVRGSVFVCNVMSRGGGASHDGPWIDHRQAKPMT
jgi:hypothetical protein